LPPELLVLVIEPVLGLSELLPPPELAPPGAAAPPWLELAGASLPLVEPAGALLVVLPSAPELDPVPEPVLYWSLVPPLLHAAKTNAALAITSNFFIADFSVAFFPCSLNVQLS
jgi:hypothetical protein